MNIDAIRSFLESQDEGRGSNEFHGKIPAKKQRELFGEFHGKGTIHIDWVTGEVCHTIKVCFGQDFHETWSDNIWQDKYDIQEAG